MIRTRYQFAGNFASQTRSSEIKIPAMTAGSVRPITIAMSSSKNETIFQDFIFFLMMS